MIDQPYVAFEFESDFFQYRDGLRVIGGCNGNDTGEIERLPGMRQNGGGGFYSVSF